MFLYTDNQLTEWQKNFTIAEATNHMLTGLIGERAANAEFIRLAQENPKGMIDSH